MAEFEIPYRDLSADALQGIIEEFVTREGTDYGHEDYSLSAKVDKVKRQLERGDVVILYDSYLETCTLVVKAAQR